MFNINDTVLVRFQHSTYEATVVDLEEFKQGIGTVTNDYYDYRRRREDLTLVRMGRIRSGTPLPTAVAPTDVTYYAAPTADVTKEER